MAWVRSREPVLAKIRLTCVLTVASLTKSARAISRLDLPAAMRRSTSDSPGVRSVSAGSAAPPAGPAAVLAAGARGGRQQPLLHLGIEHRLAGRGGQHRPADLGPGGVLGQVTERAGLQGADDRFVVGVGGQHDHLGLRMAGPDAARRLHPVAARHVQVHEDDLRVFRRDDLDGGLAVLGLAGHGDPGHGTEQQHQALADGGLVVGDDDGNRLRVLGHAGIFRQIRHVPAAGPASSVPPAPAARSRRPFRPAPAPVAASGPAWPAGGSGLATVTMTWPASKPRLSATGWPGACLRALVSPSCAVRYATRLAASDKGRGSPVTVKSTASSPTARYCAAARSSRVGGPGSPPMSREPVEWSAPADSYWLSTGPRTFRGPAAWVTLGLGIRVRRGDGTGN